MQIGTGGRGMREKANEIDRIALEDFRVGNVQPIVVDTEVGLSGEPRAASSS